MGFRTDPEKYPNRAKIQFTTNAAMPYLIYRACLETHTVSNTVYCQIALATALSKDLNIPIETLLAELPAPRGPARHLYDPREDTMNRGRISTRINEDPSGGVTRIGWSNSGDDMGEPGPDVTTLFRKGKE